MGCVASAVAVREKSKAKVQPVPSPSTLRGDLLSRNEARQRRNKSVTEHHAKTKKLAQAIAYSTMAEKEMMSTTSTEQSYRSGRAFLISTAASSQADNNASEQGSSSTVSDRAKPLSPQQQPPLLRNKTDPSNAPSKRLPFSVPEEESLHQQQDSGDDKGQEVKLGDVRGQGTDLEGTRDGSSDERTQECSSGVGSHSHSRMDMNIDEHQVKGHKTDLDSEVSQMDGDIELKSMKPARVRFEDRTEVMSEVKEVSESEHQMTKSTENGAIATTECLPAG